MRTFKLYFYGFLALLFVIFILQNYSTLTNPVVFQLRLGFVSLYSLPIPVFLIAPLFFFFGLLLATIIGWGTRRRLTKEIKMLKSSMPLPKPEAKGEPNPKPKPEPKPEVNPESKFEAQPAPKSEPQPTPRQEPIPEIEPKKKPEEGTIVSSVPLTNKPGSQSENNSPVSS
jgi:hypothetical protein